jgi:hypothetical protein
MAPGRAQTCVLHTAEADRQRCCPAKHRAPMPPTRRALARDSATQPTRAQHTLLCLLHSCAQGVLGHSTCTHIYEQQLGSESVRGQLRRHPNGTHACTQTPVHATGPGLTSRLCAPCCDLQQQQQGYPCAQQAAATSYDLRGDAGPSRMMTAGTATRGQCRHASTGVAPQAHKSAGRARPAIQTCGPQLLAMLSHSRAHSCQLRQERLAQHGPRTAAATPSATPSNTSRP